jgi:hypothetical protein
MTSQPLALQWLVFIRDHGLDLKVTLGERALASLLPTYGQGKNITVRMKSLARVTGWSRTTVLKHRDGLIAKGLLEDITGDPDKQERTYRLTMPGYFSEGVQNLDTGVQNLDRGCSDSAHNIKTEIKTEIKKNINITADAVDDGCEEDPSESKSTSDDEVGPQMMDWDDPDDGGDLAERLGVSLASIGKPFRAWFDGLTRTGELDLATDFLALHYAIKDSAGKRNPVGYLQAILPGYISELRSDRQAFKDRQRKLHPAAA